MAMDWGSHLVLIVTRRGQSGTNEVMKRGNFEDHGVLRRGKIGETELLIRW